MARKFTYEEVFSIFQEKGCLLLEDVYQNSKIKMSYKCVCGNVSKISLENFKEGNRCKSCRRENLREKFKTDISVVRSGFSKSGLTLKSENYLNDRIPLKFLCENGHEGSMTYARVKRGSGCRQCAFEKRAMSDRHGINHVREVFKEHGCRLLSTTYVNSKKPLEFKCFCGAVTKKSYTKFVRNPGCKHCNYFNSQNESRLSYEFVKNYFTEKGCVLLEKEYTNNSTKMEYICECGNKSSIRFQDFKNGKRCYDCGIKKTSGENSAHWNPDRPQYDRDVRREFPEYRLWRKNVFKRDNYTCVICGTHGKYLNAHHLEGYHWHFAGRFDVDNGVTLCRACHQDFHNTYGRKNNTKEQFEEWKRNKED